ncbi:M23 family metallopeptidase [Marinirhabdus gelatinilytica]|uniref:Peptidase M23-like protein n=1 Tax=Marinirhabdus gelatinilytica TaxID=1703343 RepID=A0A370QAG4_9FLAO|nr:M23 family metallopeptidase [Marinirhabdus gelatinilytica]RDK85361.1 peptidase M23-like protein [Marinirhabdus gelatinilytica]
MKQFFISTALFFGIFATAQQELPQDYFSDPLEIPLILSGSFGELRSNHFHSGLDIKTQQREGLPIFAPADGYVKRIKVAHYGYGKALYIQHPNGYTTVYAHLQRFANDIEDYVKQKQYEKERYEFEAFPESKLLSVKKGEIIGYTGNSGSSGGPHLHFEIRDAASRPMNPMLFGIEIPDTKKPLVNSVFVYPIGEGAHANDNRNRTKLRLIRQKDGNFKAEKVTALGKIGFGVSTYDQQNGASNKNGTYQIKTNYNGTEKFHVLFERFSFAETRYLNRFMDFEYFKTNKSRVQKLFRQENNPLSVIVAEDDNGYVTVEEGFASDYTITLSDFKGNTVTIVVPIEGKAAENPEPKNNKETDHYVYHKQGTAITKGKFDIYIPAESLYENTYLDVEATGDTLSFHEDVLPIHKNITISVDASNYETDDISKLYIGRLNYRGLPLYNNTSRRGNKLTTRTRTFGKYVLATDTTAPTVEPVNFQDGKWISKNTTLKIEIEDDLSGISSYRATVNGKFILMEYNYKTDILTHNFADDIVTDTENNLKLIVVDNVGNSTTFEATFFRK